MSRVVINGESADYFNTIEGVLYSSRFGAEVMLYGKNVSEEYLTKCAEYFDTLPGEISEKLRQATAAYLNDMLEEHAGEFAFDVIEFNAQNAALLLFQWNCTRSRSGCFPRRIPRRRSV